MWFVSLCLVAAGCTVWAQELPRFELKGVRVYGGVYRVLRPGSVGEIYGTHLAAAEPCPTGCEVRVMLGDVAAEVTFASQAQVNFRVPLDAALPASVPLRVCVGEACSESVALPFSKAGVIVSVAEPVYARMPVWMDVALPPGVRFERPMNFGPPFLAPGYEVELRRDGALLEPRSRVAAGPGLQLDTFAQPVVPLHLLFPLDEPGTYSVRMTVRRDGRVLYESEWADFRVGMYLPGERDAWFERMEAELRSSNVYWQVASLLAWPDERALAMLLSIIPQHAGGCANTDCLRLMYGQAALAWFDEALLRRMCPPAMDQCRVRKADGIPGR